MKRILIGLIAVAVLAAGGWFGFNLYAKHRVTAEIETAFEQIRKQGGKASHGKVAFDLATPDPDDRGHRYRARPAAAGADQDRQLQGCRRAPNRRGTSFPPTASRSRASTSRLTAPSVRREMKATYKIPQTTMTRLFRARSRLQGAASHRTPSPTSIASVLEQFASVSASSITVPTIAVTMTQSRHRRTGSAASSPIRVWRCRTSSTARSKRRRRTALTFAIKMAAAGQAGQAHRRDLSNLTIDDFDASAMLAALDPQTRQ